MNQRKIRYKYHCQICGAPYKKAHRKINLELCRHCSIVKYRRDCYQKEQALFTKVLLGDFHPASLEMKK